jgi:hypothetical protein
MSEKMKEQEKDNEAIAAKEETEKAAIASLSFSCSFIFSDIS